MQHNGYYALRNVGIYKNWHEVEEAIKGMPNPQFRSFRTLSAADAYMNGWEDSTNSSSNPFGFAGPSSLPPVPADRLGREHTTTSSSSKSKSSRSRMRHRPASSLVSASPTNAAGPLSSNSANTTSLQPLAGSLAPLPSVTVETGSRRRSPLIQSVLEEEEESTSDPEQPLTPDSSDAGCRSRSDSVVSGQSVGLTAQGTAGGSRKKTPLKIGSMFSSIRPITPPSSPEPSGSDAGGDGCTTGMSSWSTTSPTESRSVNKSRFSFKRLSMTTVTSTVPTPPTVPPKPLASLGQVISTHASARPKPASIWSAETLERPRQQPSLASLQSSNQSSDSILMDPLSPFACSAPAFSRSSSSSSSVVLPCRSPSSSTASLHRPKSIQSLHHVRSSSSLFSAKSGISEARHSGLRPVEPHPTLKSLCSHDSISPGAASVDSFSDALTHISGHSAVNNPSTSSMKKLGNPPEQTERKPLESKSKGWKKALSGFKRAVTNTRA